jgi:hypothetical protein
MKDKYSLRLDYFIEDESLLPKVFCRAQFFLFTSDSVWANLGKFSTPWNGFSMKCSPIMSYKNSWMMEGGDWTFSALKYFSPSTRVYISHKILSSLFVYNFLPCWLHKFLHNFFFVSIEIEQNFCLLSAKWNFLKKEPFYNSPFIQFIFKTDMQKLVFLGSVMLIPDREAHLCFACVL